MKIIEIKALDNGAHNNQTIYNVDPSKFPIPEGWAVIPEDMVIPDTFPFVDITAKDGVVTSMIAGTMPEPEPKMEPEPSQLDILEAQVTYTAMMTDTLLGG